MRFMRATTAPGDEVGFNGGAAERAIRLATNGVKCARKSKQIHHRRTKLVALAKFAPSLAHSTLDFRLSTFDSFAAYLSLGRSKPLTCSLAHPPARPAASHLAALIARALGQMQRRRRNLFAAGREEAAKN